MKAAQKRELAQILYLRENLSQKEIATKVEVTEKTVSKWKEKYEWDKLKASLIITKDQQLRRLYAQINELNTLIEGREEGKRFANSKEADTLGKLAAAVRNFETEVSIAETIEVFREFLDWLRKHDVEKAQDIASLQDRFIKSLML